MRVASDARVAQIGNKRLSLTPGIGLARLQCSKRYGKTLRKRQTVPPCAKGMGDSVVGSWLELSKLVTSDAAEHKSAFPELARDIGADVYVDFNGWHLFLKDISITPEAKLHTVLAQQLAPDLLSKGFDERDIEDLLKKVPLLLGGGKVKVSLYDSIPSYPLNDLMKICKNFAEEN